MRNPWRSVVWCMAMAATTVAAEGPWVPAEHPATVPHDLPGVTRPRRVLVLSAELAGRVVEVHGEVGQRVDAGDAVTLHDVLARQDLLAAQADVTVAETARRRAELDDVFRRQELTRLDKLAAKGRVSAEELAAAGHAAEQASLALAAAEAQVVRARTGAARAQEILDRHRIAAPAGLTVLRRHVEPGTVVSSGQPLLTLADCQTLVVEVNVTTEELAGLRAAPTLQVEFPGTTTTAQVRLARVDPDVAAGTRRRRVELEMDGAKAPEAVGGLETVLRLRLPDPAGGVLVPADRVRLAFDHQVVSLADGRILPITPLRQEDAYVVVPGSVFPAGAALP